MMNTPVKRNILLNPGPATTTDTVKYAQIVPDICPREKEFGEVMRTLSADLVRVVHADPEKFSAVLFCGSGTVNIDACISSLTPAGKKILIVNNGAYSDRGREVCDAYHMDYVNLLLPYDKPASPEALEEALAAHPEVGVVYACHHETGTGLLNPIRELGAAAHRHGCTFIVDTTSSYAMLPIHMEEDNLDFIMASAQKGLMAMTGLSFVIGRTKILEASRNYPTRSYYTNLYMQYAFLKDKGEMHFTPPVQTIYAAVQGMKEYWQEGEQAKCARHRAVYTVLRDGMEALGFRTLTRREDEAGLVVSLLDPDDPAWNFEKIHDYCYARGFTIYPGKLARQGAFRLCSLGALQPQDARDFLAVFREALAHAGVSTPVYYQD